jgi:hypothetical protein
VPTDSKKRDIIRLNDRVRIVIPQVVTRVGYPKAVGDYLEEARVKLGPVIMAEFAGKHCPERALDRIYQQFAYALAKADGFGGRDRTLHLKEVPDLLGQEFNVSGVRMVQTGTYYPPSYSSSYYGDDYEPGGLMDMKARRLVSGFWLGFQTIYETVPEIPVEHLEKVRP